MYFSRSGQRARQCDQAIKAFNISANERCCDDDNKMLAGENCDRDGYPDFLAWNFKAKGSKTPLDWEAAMKEINDRQPFIFAWREKEPTVASTHMIVVEGYKDDGSEKWLYVVDPAGFQVPADAYEIPYLQYAGEGQYESVTNYFEIKPLAE